MNVSIPAVPAAVPVVNHDEADDESQHWQQDEEALPESMSQYDPLRMKMLLVEKWWALEIKEAMERDPELDTISDFWIAQLALICEHDVDDALRRAAGLQALREAYGMEDTYECGCRAHLELVRLFPEAMLMFDYSQSDGVHVIGLDASKFRTGSLRPKQFESLLAGLYFMMHAACPDLQSVRKGTTGLIECKGMDFGRKKDLKATQRLYDEFWSVYPVFGCARHYNSGVLFNVMFSLWKRVLPECIRNRFRAGLVFEGGLHSVCLVPTPEEATKRILNRMKDGLQRRFENEQNFSLETCTVADTI